MIALQMKPSIFISAGEVSGDLHAARLVRALRRRGISNFVGMGGEQMAAEGVVMVDSVINRSTIGFIEPIRHLFSFYRAYWRIKQWLRQHPPTVLVAVDFQGFNMQVCRFAKSLGIPVVYYIAPQEWQWGSESGGRRVVAATDLILSIFPREHAFYSRLGGKSEFIGHPLLDIVPMAPVISDSRSPVLTVFPGSRSQEITRVLPVMVQAIQRIRHQFPELKVVVSAATAFLKLKIDQVFQSADVQNVEVIESAPYQVMAMGTVSLVTSGTVTLEHAIMNKPAVAAYRFHPISYRIGRLLVGKKFDAEVGYIALPNIYLRREAMPEFLQQNCHPKALADAVIQLLTHPEKREVLTKEYAQVRELLGGGGAIDRAARRIQSTWFSGIMGPKD